MDPGCVKTLERSAAVYKFQSIFGRFPPLQARRSEKVRSKCAVFRQFPSFRTAWTQSSRSRGAAAWGADAPYAIAGAIRCSPRSSGAWCMSVVPQSATIIGSPVSPYVRKVLTACEMKGVPYRLDPIVPFFGDDRFGELSPLRRIPVFIDERVSLCDSTVISEYLEDRFP